MSDITPQRADALLSALGEQIAGRSERYELVVIGGSALLALGLVERTTKDVDIVALRSGEDLEGAEPLPEGLCIARDLVAREFGAGLVVYSHHATTRSTSSSTPPSTKARESMRRICARLPQPKQS